MFVADVEYPKNLHKQHSHLPFLPERMEIDKRTKLVSNLNDKENYAVHILALKQALNHGLKLSKVHDVIEFRQNAWLKSYIDMNTELRKKAKNEFEKELFKLMSNSVFGKTMEDVRNHRDIRVITADKRKSILASESNYYSTKYISKDLLIMEMKKTEVRMNKPAYLGQAILDISKTLMYEFWYDYIKPKYGDKARLCYMGTDSFIMLVQTDDFYIDISNDVERWFDTSNFDENDNRQLEIGKNKKVIGKFKDEIGGKIMTEFCALRAKAYAYKLDDDTERKRAKGTKKCIVKKEIIFKNNVDALFNDKVIIKWQQRSRSDHHKVYIEEVNKIALSSNDDRRIQILDKVTTFPYGTNAFMVCENEMLLKNKFIDKTEDNDLLMVRNKSLNLRSEAQELRNKSQEPRNELQELKSEAEAIRNASQVVRLESQNLRSEKQTPQNESLMLRNRSVNLRSEAHELRNKSQELRNELQELKSEVQAIRKMSQGLRNESQNFRSMTQTPQNESLMLRNKSNIFRSEAQALRNESFLARNES